MANKQARIASLIQKNISDIILFELRNPIMRLVTVNACIVSNDYSVAKIYISHLDHDKISEALDELNRAKGAIRTSLAKKMDIYKVPELIFIIDDTYDRFERIEELLNKVNKK
jgi:ribosome-binding factor A